jgi:hypothetical protein
VRRALIPLALVLALGIDGVAQARVERSPVAHAASCTKTAKKLRAFKRAMPRQKRAFFRKHRGAAERRAFVRRQGERLKALKRAHARCLAREQPAPGPGVPAPAPPAPGLPGPAPAAALDQVKDVFSADAFVTDAEVTDGVVRTQIELAFREDATVAEVDALLARIGGRIVSSRAGTLIAVVEIPDPGGLAALDALIAQLAGEPVVRAALPTFVPEPDELPEQIAFGSPEIAALRSQLAVRAHAAWNARAALAGRTPPTLVLADWFGDGAPGAGTDISAPAADFANVAGSHDHGYMVLGITSGAFDALGLPTVAAENVTGMFPGTLPVRAVDMMQGLSTSSMQDRVLELIENAPGDVVLNTSMGFPCDTPAEASARCNPDFAGEKAEIWIEKVRGTDPGRLGANLEGKFVHMTSAGNFDGLTGALGAAVNSEYAGAALLPLSVPNLQNTLVVENYTATATEPYRPGCLTPSSEFGGTTAGIGAPVHSFNSPAAAETFADGGTSAATPQVAGLAAYLWTLEPSLSPTQLGTLIESTARGECGAVIDAYSALLATDVGNPARPVRTAVLDVADSAGDPGSNGRFDGHDLDELLAIFQAQEGKIDYGRGDLNGDGVTRSEPGVTRRDRFDLDVDGAWGVATEDVEGFTVRFDERSLSDENILCHSTYSALWLGPLDQRRDQLGLARCLDLQLDDAFPARVRAGESNTLTITAASGSILDDDGEPLGQEDVYLELEPTGGTVSAGSGTTDADGDFTTTATLADGETSLQIHVKAFDRQGGELLAEHTVTAQLVVDGTVSIDAFYAHISVRAGVNDDDKETFSQGWSMSGSTGGGGATASVSASASGTQDGDTWRYSGSGDMDATAAGDDSGAAVGIDGTIDFTVSGGEVRYTVRQAITGTFPPGPFLGGCQVRLGGQVVGPSGNAGGILEPGSYTLSHDCGGGSVDPEFPVIDAHMTFSVVIGPG